VANTLDVFRDGAVGFDRKEETPPPAMMRCSRNTVDAVRSRRWSEVEQRKELIRALAARGAMNGMDQLNELIEQRKLPPALLMSTTGMLADKLIALSNDPQHINVCVQRGFDDGKRTWERLEELSANLGLPPMHKQIEQMVQSGECEEIRRSARLEYRS